MLLMLLGLSTRGTRSAIVKNPTVPLEQRDRGSPQLTENPLTLSSLAVNLKYFWLIFYRLAFLMPNWSKAIIHLQMLAEPSTI